LRVILLELSTLGKTMESVRQQGMQDRVKTRPMETKDGRKKKGASGRRLVIPPLKFNCGNIRDILDIVFAVEGCNVDDPEYLMQESSCDLLHGKGNDCLTAICPRIFSAIRAYVVAWKEDELAVEERATHLDEAISFKDQQKICEWVYRHLRRRKIRVNKPVWPKEN